jgi:signal transduction histidine kinase
MADAELLSAPPADKAARVLIVDDYEAVRKAHARILSQHGYSVEAAESAEQALSAIRETPFDAILSDIAMPGMSGVELAKELRASNIDVPMVLITGNPELHTAIEAVKLGILRYLTKPVERLALVTVTQEVIRLHGLARAARLALDNESLRGLVEELHRAREAAAAGSRAKTEFLSMMSHEIRTPLTAVLGYTELLLDEPLSDEGRDWTRRIKAAAGLSLKLSQNLLDMAALAAGETLLTVGPFDLSGTLTSIVGRFQPTAQAKGLLLRCDVDPRIPKILSGDALKFAQVVEHLLDNAIKFTERGKVEVRAELEPSSGTPSVVKVSVSDTGIGITKEAHTRIIEAFSQADNSATRRFGGSGLGLAISSALARLMGGALHVESANGAGACASFTAPMSMGSCDG